MSSYRPSHAIGVTKACMWRFRAFVPIVGWPASCFHSAASLNAESPESSKRSLIPTSIVTQNGDYCKGIKIYEIGIKEDPIPGEKRGKGIQHLTSSYWIYDMGVFISRNFEAMHVMAQYANDHTDKMSCGDEPFDFRYYMNVSNALFLKAEAEGLRTADSRDFFLMACWCAMAAAEVDGFTYSKYSPEERLKHRAAFYSRYLHPSVVWDDDEEDDIEAEKILGKFCVESCRIDMIPTVALERLGIHNELCSMKWENPHAWMREGFVVSARFDSMKRHYESIHARDMSEDHLAHLIWGFMALTHVIAVFPQMNNLTDFERLRRRNLMNCGDPSVASLVGDGGFRSGIPGRTRQSGRPPPLVPSIDPSATPNVSGRPDIEATASS